MNNARRTALLIVSMSLCLSISTGLHAQARRGGPPPTAKAMAPIDLTGYWTAVITEDWHTRMLTAIKNDMGSGTFPIQAGGRGAGQSNIPLNAEGRRVVAAWDPARDEAEGNQCKAYGAAGILRQPTRLHITWQDDNTLKMETDYGTQTRLFHFVMPQVAGGPATTKPEPQGAPTWQGYSAAEWIIQGGRGNWPLGGNLKVVTTNMKPGYYWKNGIPYSGNAAMTEHFRVARELDNSEWIHFSAAVDDPTYLTQPYIVTYHFKKLPNGNDWSPTPCTVK